MEHRAHCIFEYIYFARLDSTLDGISVYDARLRAGAALAKAWPAQADLVCGVPDSGVPAAKGFSQASGIPFGIAFYKKQLCGQDLYQAHPEGTGKQRPPETQRAGVRGEGKAPGPGRRLHRRGTTIANLIHMLKAAGALSVHVRISSPPFLYPCYFGTDIPSNRQLIASSHSAEEICSMIGADSLGYLDIEDLPSMAGDLPLCRACFDGRYPMDIETNRK